MCNKIVALKILIIGYSCIFLYIVEKTLCIVRAYFYILSNHIFMHYWSTLFRKKIILFTIQVWFGVVTILDKIMSQRVGLYWVFYIVFAPNKTCLYVFLAAIRF